MSTTVPVQVEGRQLTLSNLDKPMYLDGYTKDQAIHYYTRIARCCCPTLPAGR